MKPHDHDLRDKQTPGNHLQHVHGVPSSKLYGLSYAGKLVYHRKLHGWPGSIRPGDPVPKGYT